MGKAASESLISRSTDLQMGRNFEYSVLQWYRCTGNAKRLRGPFIKPDLAQLVLWQTVVPTSQADRGLRRRYHAYTKLLELRSGVTSASQVP
ncbi:hypothetical protein H920_19663 [Fukomys damarensis]|uniref:Uncharacterized protein n=1 Tax=Fukomys damarensis TaxID=885580 RepID=A0A091CJZ9_FUKDA|nr:hypothetical protein H920_19663 [Fukomys damarensis]